MRTEYIGVVIGILTFLGGLLAWYRASVESSVSLKRDWNHLKKNQEQMIQNVAFLTKEMDSRLDHQDLQLIELKGMFYTCLTRIERADERP